jgi:hypothetical protein
MQYLEKIENKVDCARITFFKLNKFKQLIVQKKKHDPLSVLRLLCQQPTLIRTIIIEV